MLLSKYLSFLWVCGVLLSSCEKKALNAAEYRAYFQDSGNGLVQEKEIDRLVFRSHFLTPQVMAVNEAHALGTGSQSIQVLTDEYSGLTYFNLTVAGGGTEHVHSVLAREGFNIEETEAYLNFDGQKDITLLAGQDTFPCVLYNFSKTYGLAKQLNLSVAFDLPDNHQADDLTIDWNASVFNRGLIKLRFDKNDIVNIPNIKL